MQNFNYQRWIPIILVLAASYALITLSRPRLETEEAAAISKIELPPPPAEYAPPPGMRNIFEYGEKVSSAETLKSTGTAKGRGKAAKPELAGVFVEGIVWSQSNPMVSVNGVLLTEGTVYRNLKVVRITPDRVVLSVNGKTIEKRFARVRKEGNF